MMRVDEEVVGYWKGTLGNGGVGVVVSFGDDGIVAAFPTPASETGMLFYSCFLFFFSFPEFLFLAILCMIHF